jgi:Heavy metal binding domain
LIGAIALTTSASAQVGAIDPNRPDRAREREKKQRYTCPMHPEVVRAEPGQCPKCGTTLVPIKEERKRPTPNPQHPTPNSEHVTHDANGMAMPTHEHAKHDQDHDHEMQMSMQSSVNIADPMSRESSGTSWVPDSTPIYGHMWMVGDDMLMLHGAIFPRYTNVSTRRGDDRIDAPNWIMGMFSHSLGESTQLGLRAMMSLDPLTEGGRGYPLLLQSGESWHDQPLHDRQHPHDLFDELSLTLSQRLIDDFSGYLYFGYPGEPALGPPTFMHRLSAMDNPDAPIGHHWQDSTHVTFGVATAGLQWSRFGGIKIEGSAFTGREPDEHRYDFDRPRFDSFSGRVSWNPTQNLALQVSHGYIKSPEALEPGVKRHRTTASAIYNQPLGHDTNWSTSFVWGQNNDSGETTQSFLLESNYQRGRDTVYARWERVEKSGNDLVLAPGDLDEIFPVNAATIGYVRDLSHGNKIDIGLGGQFTVNIWPNELNRYYGNGPGYAFEFFLRIRPSQHSHDTSEMEGGMTPSPK